jgi:ABC-type nitrate/sulfonate/bicarbonate transport system substrate-binding protein
MQARPNAGGGSGQPAKVVMAETSHNAVYWPTMVTLARGFDREENLTLDYVESRTSADGARFLVSGEANLTSITPDVGILASERDPNVVIAAGYMWWIPHSLVAAKDIRGIPELRGKTLSVDQVQGGNGLFLRRMLAAGGLGPNDYELVQGGTSRDRVSGLVGGSVQGTLLLSPDNARLVRDGYNLLGYVNDYIGTNYFAPLILSRRWAADNREALLRYLRATQKAIAWLQDPANRDEAIAILVEQGRLSPDDAAITYDEYVPRKVHSLPITAAQVQGALDVMAELGQLTPPIAPPDRYLDLTYLRQVLP